MSQEQRALVRSVVLQQPLHHSLLRRVHVRGRADLGGVSLYRSLRACLFSFLAPFVLDVAILSELTFFDVIPVHSHSVPP